ncbi:tRNA lysidine(34) synthetase TilS [Sulfitobacter geojensis]|uniref:tRNA lysidine(34) synthetase TilS n=1 Tax=Sulfitobacter geojensis TaxID=1342299 RepID=UPI0024921FE5|nr:tRNA lysidine(34) synthetase TilS [Sulfitobacter geojensis]
MPERLPNCLSEAFLPHPPAAMGVAVSGGSDSMALLHLLCEFCAAKHIRLQAVTVDHCLRPEAASEAAHVAQVCANIGVPHHTLVWDAWRGEGNLQNAARHGRYQAMANWAKERGIDTIATGHTADDQAETVLMRLARRSGVDGLSAMSGRTLREGITWVRPLLRTRREVLRSYLTHRGIHWVEDPSNKDARYDRIKARNALEHLAPLGIDAEALGEVAENMETARRALEWHTFLAAKHLVTLDAGAVLFNEAELNLQPVEVQRRLMIKAINWVTQSYYAPRRGALANLRAALSEGQAATMNGCHIRRIGSKIWVFREFNAVRTVDTATGGLWDGRWSLTAHHPSAQDADLRVRALGLEGLEQCADWRITGRPHVLLQSTPGVWRGDTLVAAPLAGCAQNWHAELVEDQDTFFASLLSH